MEPRKLIIDCDPGQDDAVAILMALAHPEAFDLLAITTVCGNNTAAMSTRNARIIATAARRAVRIAQGAVRPLINEPMISDQFHGKTGMDGHHVVPDEAVGTDPRHGVEVLRDLLLASPDKVTLAALGPLTNLALLLRTYPETAEKIELISLMGGGLAHGNMTETAEFNLYVDPEAAQIVFSSGVPIVMSGLDVTEQVTILPQEYEFLRSRGPVGVFFCEMMDFYGRGSAHFNAVGCVMHDPCAVAYLLAPQLFDGPRGAVDITLSGPERGRTVLTPSPDGTTQVLTRTDAPEAAALILDCIATLCAQQV